MALTPESHTLRVQIENCNHETLSGRNDLIPCGSLEGLSANIHPIIRFRNKEAALGR